MKQAKVLMRPPSRAINPYYDGARATEAGVLVAVSDIEALEAEGWALVLAATPAPAPAPAEGLGEADEDEAQGGEETGAQAPEGAE